MHEREQRRGADERDRRRAGVVVDPAPDAACSARPRSGSELPAMKPGDARHRVQREHERVAAEDAADVADAGGRVDARAGAAASGRASTTVRDDPDARRAARTRSPATPSEPAADDAATARAFQRAQRRAGVVDALDEGEVAAVHHSWHRRAAGRGLSLRGRDAADARARCAQLRARATTASSAIRHDIFDAPAAAVAEDDRHLDDAEAGAQRAVGQLDLEGVAVRAHGRQVDRLEHLARGST